VRILVTGITGYVGSALAPRLQRDGHDVLGLARRPERAAADVPVLPGDAVTGTGLEEAMDGVEVVYYLIHSMEPAAAANGSFGDRERRAVENVVSAARAAGVRRIVYLGGPVPDDRPPSEHLASRVAVEEALLTGVPDSVAFRASIVIAARSRSFRFLVRLIERLPVMALPGWRVNRTAPIDGRDVLEYLARAATEPAAAGLSLDLPGPDVVTYQELIERIRDSMLVGRPRRRRGRRREPRAHRAADGGPARRPPPPGRPRAGDLRRPPPPPERGDRTRAPRLGGDRTPASAVVSADP
jgi:uncharacterized protein YbjT (DUF2867 family)